MELNSQVVIDGNELNKLKEKYKAVNFDPIEKRIFGMCEYYSRYSQDNLEDKYKFEEGKKIIFLDEIKDSITLIQFNYEKKKDKPISEKKIEEEIKILWDKELKDYQEEDIEWVIEKLIPNRSVVILTGKRGTLKTFVTLLLSYSIALGNDFLDKFKTKKGKVIYLDKENGISIMKNRTNMIKKGLELEEGIIDVGFICFSQIKIDKDRDMEQIEQVLKEHKPVLLVIDTYRRGISFDENDAGSVSELFVDTLRPLVEKNNMSILLIHHNRKGTGGEVPDEMDELRGSSDLANYVDGIIKTERKGENLILKQLKNRSAQEEPPIKIKCEFDEETIKMIYSGEYIKQSKMDKCIESLILWITKNSLTHFTTKEASDFAFQEGFKRTTFKNSLAELQNRGIIESSEIGTYKIIKQNLVESGKSG